MQALGNLCLIIALPTGSFALAFLSYILGFLNRGWKIRRWQILTFVLLAGVSLTAWSILATLLVALLPK